MKLSVYIATSLDGFIARPDGTLDWLPGSDGQNTNNHADHDFGYSDFMATVDTLVIGRHTFDFVQSTGQWPYAGKRVIILSASLQYLPDSITYPVELKSATPMELTKTLQADGCRHVYIDGGKTIQGFLRANLIDELIITRVPVLIGNGIPLFGKLDQDIRLIHVNTEFYANGFVQSRYQRQV